MASFWAKICWGRLRNTEKKKKKSFQWVLTRPVIENSKKIAKNSKKIKKHYYGFFSSQKKLRTAEKERKLKKNRSDEFLPDSQYKIPKKYQKNSKN